MQRLSIQLMAAVDLMGGAAAAAKAWGVNKTTVLRWMKASHPPSLDALQRVIASVPPDMRDSIYMAIEADAGAAARARK